MCDHKSTQTAAATAKAESVGVPITAPKVDIANKRAGKLDYVCLHEIEGHMRNDEDDTTSTTEDDNWFDASSQYDDSPAHSATCNSLVKFDLKVAMALRVHGIHVPVVDVSFTKYGKPSDLSLMTCDRYVRESLDLFLRSNQQYLKTNVSFSHAHVTCAYRTSSLRARASHFGYSHRRLTKTATQSAQLILDHMTSLAFSKR